MAKRSDGLVLCLLSLVAVTSITAARPARAADPLVLTIGDPVGDHAQLVFLSDKKSGSALSIRTVRAGVAGARLQLSVDRSPRPLISTILTEKQCRFGDSGSMCELTVSGKSTLYRDVVHTFRLGLMAHLTIENAGVMAMSSSVSLRGFTAEYRGL